MRSFDMSGTSPCWRQSTRSSVKPPCSSRPAFACAMTAYSSRFASSHARQADGELVGNELADRADAPVAEVVDVVHVPASLVQLDEVADDGDKILLRQHRIIRRQREAEALIDLVAADAPQIIALRAEEEPLERLLRGCRVRRLAKTEQRVDLRQRFLLDVV